MMTHTIRMPPFEWVSSLWRELSFTLPPLSGRAIAIMLAVLAAVAVLSAAAAVVRTLYKRLDSLAGSQGALACAQVALLDALTPMPAPAQHDEAPEPPAGRHRLALGVGHELVKLRRRAAQLPSTLGAARALCTGLGRLERELSSCGYTVRDLSGQAYTEGLHVQVAEFVPAAVPGDADRITRSLKPEISYHGRIVQPAVVTVATSHAAARSLDDAHTRCPAPSPRSLP